MRSRLAERNRWELAAYAVLIVLALGLRLADLGARPFHHDESQDAYFSYIHQFEYDPLLHGPFRFYLTAGLYALLGASDFVARLAPALMGTILVGLPYLVRDQIGRVAAFTSAVLLAFGPSYLYFSRFAREDIYIACITLGMLVVAMRMLDRPRPYHPAILLGLLAASFATKETTFIIAFVTVTFFAVVLVVEGVRGESWSELRVVRALAGPGGRAWLWGVASFLAVYAVLFSVGGTHPRGLLGLYDGLDYWLGQQPVARGGEPEGFYAFLLFGVEWPVLLFGVVGSVAVIRAPTLQRLFLVWMFAVSLAVYSWASEKFAWLILHPLLPLVLLAGIGVQAVWSARARWSGRAGLAVAAVGAVYLVFGSYQVNAVSPADPRELLVSTQSSNQVVGVRDEVRRIAARAAVPVTVTIDAHEGATFPWAWYFRDLGAGYLDMSQPGVQPDAQVLILTEASRTALGPALAVYEGRRFDFRVWWVKDYGAAASPRKWARWMTTREPWNATGGMPEWLYVRRDVTGSER